MIETGFLQAFSESLLITILDVLPIVIVLSFFQLFVIRKPLPHFKRFLMGSVMVVVGLSIFLIGLEECVFPLGSQMAEQLSNPEFLTEGNEAALKRLMNGKSIAVGFYFWVIVFAFCIGFATTLAEPALIAVAMKAREISTGAISTWGLRIAVAIGVGVGVALGTYRIIIGTPLHYFIIAGYVALMVQTYFAPKFIVALAFDSGGVTTSTVTVPLIVALGIGLSSHVPGSSPLMDGFGLIAFASLFPMITVQAYAMISERIATWKNRTS